MVIDSLDIGDVSFPVFLSSLVEVGFDLFHVGRSFKFWTPCEF